jgi:hypothetical protein
MREASRFRGMPLFGFAVAGLVLGHVLSYLIAIPDPHHRDLVLHRTGHGYLPALAQVAVILAIAAVATVVGRAFASRPAVRDGSCAALARRLAIVQVAAFGGQELLERLVAGAPLDDLVHGYVLLAGVTAQVVVALAGAALLRWLARVSDALAESSTPAHVLPRPAPVFAVTTSPEPVRGRLFASPVRGRAPPSA